MTKRQIFFKILDYKARIAKGSDWISFVDTYIPVSRAIDYAGTFIIVKLAVEKQSWMFIGLSIAGLLLLKIVWELFKWVVATIYFKLDLWKAELDWNSKNEKYNTYAIEQMNTLKNIAEKVGAKDEFKPL
jgi:hypothetical protein